MDILLICTGNTCRSPMAEGILKKLLPDHNISSAGIFALDGTSASENAILAAKNFEVDISLHKSRQLTDEIADNSDLILCMTTNHKLSLSGVKSNYFTVGEYAETGEDVSDPYGGTLDDYIACFNQLDGLLKIIARKIEDGNNTV